MSVIVLQGSYSQDTAPLSRDSINLALAYGARAVELLDVSKRIIENQKVTLVLYEGLTETKDLKVEVLTKAITLMEKKTWWQKVWAWCRGAIVGGAVVFIAVSV